MLDGVSPISRHPKFNTFYCFTKTMNIFSSQGNTSTPRAMNSKRFSSCMNLSMKHVYSFIVINFSRNFSNRRPTFGILHSEAWQTEAVNETMGDKIVRSLSWLWLPRFSLKWNTAEGGKILDGLAIELHHCHLKLLEFLSHVSSFQEFLLLDIVGHCFDSKWWLSNARLPLYSHIT